MASPPFVIQETKPADADIVSQHPLDERSMRDNVESWHDFEHGAASGRHKIPSGTVAARDAITDWEHGSFWINEDTSPDTLQMNIGTKATPIWINVSVIITNADGGITLTSTDDGATAQPDLISDRDSPSPAVDDVLGSRVFRGRNSVDAEIDYATTRGVIIIPTDALEDGSYQIFTYVAGSVAKRVDVRAGVQIGTSPTGGDKGVGTLNAQNGVYDDGERLINILPRGHIDGLILSNDPTDLLKDIGIAAGEAVDDGQAVNMVLASALIKKLDASWAVGTNQGGLDGTESVAGTPDANTWYHAYEIRRSDTGVVDVLFSESATTPSMPTDYDQKRRIGAVLFDATPDIIRFKQEGDVFRWRTLVQDYRETAPGTSAVTRSLAVPTGLILHAIHVASMESTTTTIAYGLVTSIDEVDSTPSSSLYNYATNNTGNTDSVRHEIKTGTSAQIRTRVSVSTSITCAGHTLGWIDPRGRNA